MQLLCVHGRLAGVERPVTDSRAEGAHPGGEAIRATHAVRPPDGKVFFYFAHAGGLLVLSIPFFASCGLTPTDSADFPISP